MKKQLLIYTLGFLTPIFIGAGIASGTDILTVKPAIPVDVRTVFNRAEKANDDIKSDIKDGYVLKTYSTVMDTRGVLYLYAIMEKY